MRGACIRLSRMMPVPLRLPHNYTPVFFNTLQHISPYTLFLCNFIRGLSPSSIEPMSSRTEARAELCGEFR